MELWQVAIIAVVFDCFMVKLGLAIAHYDEIGGEF